MLLCSTHLTKETDLSTCTLRWPLKSRSPVSGGQGQSHECPLLALSPKSAQPALPHCPPSLKRVTITQHPRAQQHNICSHLGTSFKRMFLYHKCFLNLKRPVSLFLALSVMSTNSGRNIPLTSHWGITSHPPTQAKAWDSGKVRGARDSDSHRAGGAETSGTDDLSLRRLLAVSKPNTWRTCHTATRPTAPDYTGSDDTVWGVEGWGPAHRVMKQNPWCCLSSNWLMFENSTKQSLLSYFIKVVSLERVSGSRRLIKTASRHSSPEHLLKRGHVPLPPTHCWTQCGRATLRDLGIC